MMGRLPWATSLPGATLDRVSRMHTLSIPTLSNGCLLPTAPPPFVHLWTSFSRFSSNRARGECQDGHLLLPLCSPLQHTDCHHHMQAAGGWGIRYHGDIRHALRPPPHPSPHPCDHPQSSGEGQEPQDSAGLLHPPHPSLVTVLPGASDNYIGVMLLGLLFSLT